MIQILQIAGALLILAAFAAGQAGRWNPKSLPYLILNVVGAAILAVVALLDHDWGFLLLEGTWTLVSAASLIQVLVLSRRAGPPGPHPTHPA